MLLHTWEGTDKCARIIETETNYPASPRCSLLLWQKPMLLIPCWRSSSWFSVDYTLGNLTVRFSHNGWKYLKRHISLKLGNTMTSLARDCRPYQTIVTFKVATLVYRGPHDNASRYASSAPHHVADVSTRRRLRLWADAQNSVHASISSGHRGRSLVSRRLAADMG